LGTDVTIDENFSAGHGVPDAVKAIARAFNANPLWVAHPQTKHIAHADPPAGCLQLDPLDLGDASSGNQVRHERRKVEPLLGTLPQDERERLHGSKSRK
jgi:hypothetical protein